eukprot:scaffold2544_cov269-Chaetoceros_neogracile.AAC.12
MENWSTSAAAGKPVAAKSASSFLDRMEDRLIMKVAVLLRGQEEKEASSTLKPDKLFSQLPYSSTQQS